LHCGCDTDFWKPSLPKNDKFTFIHVNSSNIRSGLDLTLLAFKQAFQNNKDVQLIVKDTYQSSILKNKINSLISDNCNIIYISDRFNRSQIKDLYSSSHVGLNLLRMTSWGFPLHEMSACGCLCVTGDFEPTNVLVKKDHSILIKPSREIDIFSNMGTLVNDWGFHNPYGFDVFGYPESPRYYDFDVEEYASVLKELYYNWDRYKNIDTISPIKQNWTWEKTAINLLNMLETI
jgi:glycosyltransferase involved in cell wall biosynthesis